LQYQGSLPEAFAFDFTIPFMDAGAIETRSLLAMGSVVFGHPLHALEVSGTRNLTRKTTTILSTLAQAVGQTLHNFQAAKQLLLKIRGTVLLIST
jgi:hypothetical protein